MKSFSLYHKYWSVSIFLMQTLFSFVLLGAELELDLFDPNSPLNIEMLTYNKLKVISPLIKYSEKASLVTLSSVVRIESRDENYALNKLSRMGTGVILGRFKDLNRSFFKFQEGLLVLTANHVLLNGNFSDAQRLSLFDLDRHFNHVRDFQILSQSPGEDLALLEVEMAWDKAETIDFPKLALFDPAQMKDYQWVPHFNRVNPGKIDQPSLSFSQISPKEKISMTTQDAINSLAIITKDFWNIASEFNPGMSGGPVFSDAISLNSAEVPNYNHLLVGVMGYIFDRTDSYGYAYPLTKKTLENLFLRRQERFLNYNLRESSTMAGLTLHLSDPQLTFHSDIASFMLESRKKNSPDFNVADELVLTMINNVQSDSQTSVSSELYGISFIQKIEFEDFTNVPILNYFKNSKGHQKNISEGIVKVESTANSSPITIHQFIKSTEGSPGGGIIDGSPGGGIIEGSGGGGIIEDTGGSQGLESKNSFMQFKPKHSIEVLLLYRDGRIAIYSLDRAGAKDQLRKYEFLKDLVNQWKDSSEFNLILSPQKIKAKSENIYEGFINLNPIHEKIIELKDFKNIADYYEPTIVNESYNEFSY